DFQSLERDCNFRFFHARKFIRNKLVTLAFADERATQLARGQRFLSAEKERFEHLRKGHNHTTRVILSAAKELPFEISNTQTFLCDPAAWVRSLTAFGMTGRLISFITLRSLPRSLPRFDWPADRSRPVRAPRSVNEFSVRYLSNAKGHGLSRKVAVRFHPPVSSPSAAPLSAVCVSSANSVAPADIFSNTALARLMVSRFPS